MRIASCPLSLVGVIPILVWHFSLFATGSILCTNGNFMMKLSSSFFWCCFWSLIVFARFVRLAVRMLLLRTYKRRRRTTMPHHRIDFSCTHFRCCWQTNDAKFIVVVVGLRGAHSERVRVRSPILSRQWFLMKIIIIVGWVGMGQNYVLQYNLEEF